MRSLLFVPGNRPERFPKALAAGADVVIFDLEDAVAEADKDTARQHLATATLDAPPGVQVFVRVNAVDTPWFQHDLQLLKRPEIHGLMLPKAENAATLQLVADVTSKPVLPIIESARGLWQVLEVAKAANVHRLAFGSVDFQLDIGCDGSDNALLYARSQIVLASRVAGLAAPLDGVTVALDDSARLTADASHARALGFGGKLCIHPKQIAAIHAVFSPGEQEIAWARRVVAACEESVSGAVSVDGAMVDKPVLLRAQRLLAQICLAQ